MNYGMWNGPRNWTTSGWRQPGHMPTQSRYGSAARYGYGSGLDNYGSRTGYRGWPGGVQNRHTSAASSRWGQQWPRRYSQTSYGTPQSYGYGSQGYGYAPQASSRWVLKAQACLAQVVGAWVPQTGIMGKTTRRAIRIFQSQQQLPATGMLDAATGNALLAACGGAAAPPPPQAPAPMVAAPPPPVDDPAAAAAFAPAAPPPNAGPSGDAPPPPDASGGEPPPDATAGEFGGWRRRRLGRLWSGLPSDSNDSDGGYGSARPGGYGGSSRWRR